MWFLSWLLDPWTQWGLPGCWVNCCDLASGNTWVHVLHLLRAVRSYQLFVRNIFLSPWKLIKIHLMILGPTGSCRILLSCLSSFLLIDNISLLMYTGIDVCLWVCTGAPIYTTVALLKEINWFPSTGSMWLRSLLRILKRLLSNDYFKFH